MFSHLEIFSGNLHMVFRAASGEEAEPSRQEKTAYRKMLAVIDKKLLEAARDLPQAILEKPESPNPSLYWNFDISSFTSLYWWRMMTKNRLISDMEYAASQYPDPVKITVTQAHQTGDHIKYWVEIDGLLCTKTYSYKETYLLEQDERVAATTGFHTLKKQCDRLGGVWANIMLNPNPVLKKDPDMNSAIFVGSADQTPIAEKITRYCEHGPVH